MRISDWSSDVCSSDLSIARMERHECLTGELVNRQAISIDAENRIGGHDVANAARCNDVHRTGRGDVGQAREAKTAERKPVLQGESVPVRVEMGGRRLIKEKK